MFVIDTPSGARLLTDPWLGNNPTLVADFAGDEALASVDALLVSHGHTDHAEGIPRMREVHPGVAVFTSFELGMLLLKRGLTDLHYMNLGGSARFQDAWGENRDAIVIERLKAAGAVITGKLTAMEFAIGFHDPEKPHPRPRNPWDPSRWPGGSSSGTGAGVACGMFLAGVGTDTGGSIRLPAAYCGVSGLMPTYGRVPTAGCTPLGYTMDHIGPIARSARDCGLFLASISGDDPRDPYTVPTPPLELADRTGDLKGIRVGVERANHLGGELQDPALAANFEEAVTVVASCGATVSAVEIPYYAETVTAQLVTTMSEAFAYHRPDMQRRWTDYYRSTRAFIGTGALFTGADYVQAQRVRRVAQRRLAELFTDVDVIVTPTTTTGAATWEELDAGMTGMMSTIFTLYWDAVGNPVLVVPMGFTEAGLPLSLQLAARPFAEATLVAVADAFQAETDWHLRIPPLVPAVTTDPLLGAVPAQRSSQWTTSDRSAPDAMLAVAGLPVVPEEREHFREIHAMYRPRIEAMYALPEVRYEAPALVFQAQPKLQNWS
jgi:aspartyl-tRNA(Asn)/glutamyl-tRNA(Gln) amidotransferase subunit A